MLTQQGVNADDEPATTVLTTDMLIQQGMQAPGSGPLQGSGPLPGSGMLQGSGPLPGSGPLQNSGPLPGTGPQPVNPFMQPQRPQGPQGPMNNMPQNTGFNSGPQGMQVPGSGMLPGSGPLMPGSGPLPQMKVPQPPETAKKSSPGVKAFGIVSLILAVLGLAAVIICYFLFAVPKDEYQKASTSKIQTPTVTTATTEEPEATEAPEEEE